MSTVFQRRKEDFSCGNCGFFVVGNGYTNHCPKCLWGKHVDNHPGDRASECKGMLAPFGWTLRKGEFVLVHRCVRCGFIGRNRLSPEDDMDVLIGLKQNPPG